MRDIRRARGRIIMHVGKFAWPQARFSAFSLVCDEQGKYETSPEAAPAVRFDLSYGLSPQEVDERIARGRRAGDIGHRTVAFYLAECADRGLHQALGHPSVVPYAVKRHGIPRRGVRDLVAAGRALRDLVKIDAAFIRGDLVWSKVRAIVKVAEPATEDSWLTFAQARTIDEVEKEASLAKKGDKPRASRKGLPEVRFTVQLRVGAVVHEQYLLARKRLSADLGHEVKDDEMAGAILDGYLRSHGDAGARGDSLYRVVLDLRPAEGASIRSEDGPVPIDPAMAEAICCDAGVLTPDGKPDPRYSPPASPALRARIRARDGYKCVICSSPFELHVHHIVYREHFGSNAWTNLCNVCRSCHGLVHANFLTIEGKAPHALVFRNKNGEQLTDLKRYVTPAGEPSLEIGPAGGPIGPLAATETPRPARAVDFESVAATVDAIWMARHKHLLSPDSKRMVVKFESGHPIDPPQEEAAQADPGGPTGPLASQTPENQVSAVRPASFDDVVGQEAAVASLRLAVEAAKASGEMPDDVLLTGRPGLGKTTLSRAFAHALGGRLRVVDATTIDSPLTLIGHLVDAHEGDVIFLDEIHSLPPRISEFLYSALEDRAIVLPFSDGLRTKPVRFVLPKVTFVGATTDQGRLPEPLVARFPLCEELEPYGEADLAEIVRRAGVRSGISMDGEAAAILARASGGCARRAIHLFLAVRRLLRAARRASASALDARAALEAARIDERGFGPVHQRILAVLARHRRPMAVRRLARAAGLTFDSFRKLYEPMLFELGAIVPTVRGMALGS